ncbi:hypothetical protein CTI12_AA281810 [Artemisia annua]|uniref:Helitron helicase-like domain-containing protein n=1 Tax=Artemisia annua TaxID=35608 RepID=A0A2U1NCX6_ARTAN|nr:hypothetical protein CTI12_AA281810 [Artemisia annua]
MAVLICLPIVCMLLILLCMVLIGSSAVWFICVWFMRVMHAYGPYLCFLLPFPCIYFVCETGCLFFCAYAYNRLPFVFALLPYRLPTFALGILLFSIFNMRTKDKARRRVTSPRSLESTGASIHSQQMESASVVALGKRPISYVGETSPRSLSAAKKACSGHYLANAVPGEKMQPNLPNEGLQHFPDTPQLNNARKRKATHAYASPADVQGEGEFDEFLAASPPYKICHAGPNMEVQDACALNSSHLNIYTSTPPTTRNKGKRKVFECNIEPNYVSHQQTAVSGPCDTSNDTLQHFLCNESSCDMESDDIFDLNRSYACSYDPVTSYLPMHHEPRTQLHQQLPARHGTFSDFTLTYLPLPSVPNHVCVLPAAAQSTSSSNVGSYQIPTTVSPTPQKVSCFFLYFLFYHWSLYTLAGLIPSTPGLPPPHRRPNRQQRLRQNRPTLNRRRRSYVQSGPTANVRQGPPPTYVHMGRFDRRNGEGLRRDIVEGLIEFLDEHNQLVQLFRTARDKMAEANIPSFKVKLFGIIGSRQYELPSGDSIAAIVFEGGPHVETNFDVVIQQHTGTPQRVNKLNPSYMSLHFPLLFIYDEDGYHLGLRLTDTTNDTSDTPKKMSMKMEMEEGSSIAASTKATGKEIIAHTGTTSLTTITTSDTDKTLYVKAYRKWTVTNKNGKPVMFCCISAQEATTKPTVVSSSSIAIASAPAATTSEETETDTTTTAKSETLPESSTTVISSSAKELEQQLLATPPEDKPILPPETQVKYGPRKSSVRRALYSDEKPAPTEKTPKKSKQNE